MKNYPKEVVEKVLKAYAVYGDKKAAKQLTDTFHDI